MKRLLTVLIVLTGLGLFVPVGAQAKVKVVDKCDTRSPTKRPNSMVFTCADGNLQAFNLSWRTWGGRSTKALGTIGYKICQPDCASGTVAYRSGKVTLYGRLRCNRRLWVYSRARVKIWNGPATRMRLPTCR